MKAVPLLLTATLAAALSSSPFAQTSSLTVQAGPPGPTGPGAQVPGMPPPRDVRGLPQTGTAKLRGRVVAQTGAPLRRAQISIFATEGQVRRITTTDAEGRYEFVELPAGRFSVSATKGGYVTLQYGQRRPFEAGTPVVVADGDTVERIDFALPRGSVIAGRVADEFNEPLAQAQVQALRFQYGPDGQRRPMPTQFATTDDRGEFRLFGLMPGEYVVNAGVRSPMGIASTPNPNDSSEGFPPTFYPGTLNVDEAQPISVGVGEETSVQFALIAARLARVSGTVMTSDGRPAAGAQVMLVTRQGMGASMFSAGVVAPDGKFTLNGVPAGQHSIDIRMMPRPGVAGEFASRNIDVGRDDLDGVHIVTGRGGTLSGRVVFEGTAPRQSGLGPARVFAQSVDPGRPTIIMSIDGLSNGTLDDDGNFQLSGVTGRVFITPPAAPGWMVKSVTLDGDDITDQPIDVTGREAVSGIVITMTDKLTDVSGQVTDARGQALTDYVVVLLPAEAVEPVVASRWIRMVRPNTNGRFQARGVRPGRYVAAAVESLEQGRQFAPEFQQRLRQGAREFSVREGESVTIDLRLTAGL